MDIGGSESSLGGVNEGNLLSRLSDDSLVDLRILVLLFGSLGLLEDLLGRGELEDRLRRRRARQILIRVEATDCRDVGNIGQLEEIVLLRELADAVLTEVLLEVALLVGIPVLALLIVGVTVAIVVPAVVVPATVLQPELFRHGRQRDALGQVR